MAGSFAAAAALASFMAGVEAYQRGDYEEALHEWLPLAAENDNRALYNLGQMYRLGRGVEADMFIAEQYYRRAAALGHVAAAGNLGSIYYSKDPPRIDEALYFWQVAAHGGDRRAQFLLGVQYFNGQHVGRDYVLAYGWISLAAEAGLEDAAKALGVMNAYLTEEDRREGQRLAPGLPNKKLAALGPPPAPPPGSSDLALANAGRPPVPAAAAEPQPAGVANRSGPPKQVAQNEPSADDPGEEQVEVAVLVEQEALPPPAPAAVDADDHDGTIYRVQLASLRTPEDANITLTQIASGHADLLGDITLGIEEADFGPVRGKYFRIKSSPMTSGQATRHLCDKFRERGVACLPMRTIPLLAIVAEATIDTGTADPGGKPAPDAVKTARKPASRRPWPEPVIVTLPPEKGSSAASVSEAPAGGADLYRVQVASHRTEADAESQKRRVMAALKRVTASPEIRARIEKADLGQRGTYYRVQLAPFATRVSANDFCAALKRVRFDCFVVRTP